MNLYVIAEGKEGPSKIGFSDRPESRLASLRAGNPLPLALYHVEHVGLGARYVEKAVHLALAPRLRQGTKEWFDIAPDNARRIIRAVAAVCPILTDDRATLQSLNLQSALTWVRENPANVDYCEEYEGEDLDESNDIVLPGALDQFALSVLPPKLRQFDFYDYLKTWEDGMWVRWLFEKTDSPQRPRGPNYAFYLRQSQALEQKHGYRSTIGERWIEWSLARELVECEVSYLLDVWNMFAPLYNNIYYYGPQWDTHGIDDHVDDVHLYVLFGDESRRDVDYLVFCHEDFQAILVPMRRLRFMRFGRPALGELCKIDDRRFSGFITPRFNHGTGEQAFLKWYRQAAEKRETSFQNFLKNPNKRYPAPRAYDGPQPGTRITGYLPCIDENGFY